MQLQRHLTKQQCSKEQPSLTDERQKGESTVEYSKVKSQENTLQVRKIWSQQLEHMQVR